MLSEKNIKRVKKVVIGIIVVLILWFLVVSPYMSFKKNEKIVREAGKRYYEINAGQLPTGEKIKTVGLQKLYEKDFIGDDLRSGYMNQACDSKASWVKVRKEKGEYQYYVYLKCGIFSSKVDHKGPEIRLKGEEEIILHKGEEYKEPGIESVVDNQDGKMNIKDVEIDNRGLNTSKVGVYEVRYRIKDSFNNLTEKIRTVRVIETINHIIEKDTKKKKVYRGSQTNNYVKIDGILFQIVGENEDGSVKLVSSENISAVDYEGVEKWLNEYFYEKLSESAKKIIVKSKYCEEEVEKPEEYSKCGEYSKKKNVGLLSVIDVKNSKGEDGSYSINSAHSTMLGNRKGTKVIAFNSSKYITYSKSENIGVRPVISIRKESDVVGGDGTIGDPYIIKGNKKTLKVGSKVSEARTGEYIRYSGYTFRVIGKEKDGTTKVIMDGIVNLEGDKYHVRFSDTSSITYNPNKKGNIGYHVVNDIPDYLSTKYFSKQTIPIDNYINQIRYQQKSNKDEYSVKLLIPSMYDLFSTTLDEYYWYRDYSSNAKDYCYMDWGRGIRCKKYNYNDLNGIRLVSYFDSNVKVKSGSGNLDSPYQITK